MRLFAIRIAIGIGLCVAAVTTFSDSHDYYLFDGKPVKLSLLAGHAAFIVPESELAAVEKFAASSSVFDPITSIEPRDGYGAILLKKANYVDDVAFEDRVAEIERLLPVGAKIPVYQVGQTIMLPTKVATVELVRNYTTILGRNDPIQHLSDILLMDTGAKPTPDESRGKRPRFKVPFRTLSIDKVFPGINRANTRPEILAAWPDFIRIVPHPTSINRDTPEAGGTGGPPVSISNVCTENATPGNPNDPLFDELWPLNNIGVDNPQTNVCESTSAADGYCNADIDWLETWNRTQSIAVSAEPTIAILDVGIQKHVDLDLVDPGIDATETDPTQPGIWEPISYTQDHGTLVAGIAGAIVNNNEGITGAAIAAKLLSVRIGEYGQHSGWVLPANVAGTGIRKAALAGARVLNNSWWLSTEDPDVLTEFFDLVQEKDALFVVAAGNLNSEAGCAYSEENSLYECPFPGISFPATLAGHSNRCISDRVIAVSGTNQRDEFKTLPNYEHAPTPHGPSTAGMPDWGSRHGDAVSLAAPGDLRCTTTTDGQNGISLNYAGFYETSAAAPVVSGSAAAILSMHPGATAPQLKRWMLNTTDRGADQQVDALSGRPIPDDYFGHGRLNLNAALTRADTEMNMLPPGPPRAGVSLHIERSHRRIKNREKRHVIAKVMRMDDYGQIVPVVDEQVKVVKSGWFGWAPFRLLGPDILRTDCDGIAEMQIQGSSWIYWNGKLTVSSGNDRDSERVSVPNLPPWTLLLLGALILASLVKSRRRHGR